MAPAMATSRAGVYSFGYGTVNIENATITGNSNTGSGGARGGAGFNWPAPALGAGPLYLNITDSLIDGNYSAEDSAGFGFRATSVDNPVVMTTSGTTISNNSSGDSGAAGFLWTGSDEPLSGTVTIRDSVITGNTALGTGGGFLFNNANVMIIDTTIDNNLTYSAGGGIYISGSGLQAGMYSTPTATLIRSTVSNNYTSLNGGGIYAYDANVVLDNSTISGNTSAILSGGLRKSTVPEYVGTPYETFAELLSSTVTNNYAGDRGGGLYADVNSKINGTNSIIAGNAALGSAPDFFSGANVPDFTYSLIGDGTGSQLAPGNPDPMGNLVGDGTSPIDALLGLLGNNGGATMTHLPMPGSPAIDAGDPATMGGVDQTQGSRVNDGRIDMGSVETGEDMPVVDCDFDDDGDCGVDDIDMLTAETANMMNNPAFDLTGDMLVNGMDINAWLIEAGARPENAAFTNGNPFFRGDANLDGLVDGQDFVALESTKFCPGGGCNGVGP